MTFQKDVISNFDYARMIFALFDLMFLKERNFRVDLFSRVIFLTLNVDLISRIGYRWIFREDLISLLKVNTTDLSKSSL